MVMTYVMGSTQLSMLCHALRETGRAIGTTCAVQIVFLQLLLKPDKIEQ